MYSGTSSIYPFFPVIRKKLHSRSLVVLSEVPLSIPRFMQTNNKK